MHTFIILANCWRKKIISFRDLPKRSKRSQGQNNSFIILANCWNHDRRSKSNGSMRYDVHKVTPFMVQCVNKISWPCKKVKVKTKGLEHNFIILLTVNTMKEGQSQTVQWVMVSTKMTPVHGTMCEKMITFVTLQKGQEKVKTTGLVHNFIILANCWRIKQF